MKDEGGGRGGRRHVNNVGDQTQQKQPITAMLQQTTHTDKQDFIRVWTNLKLDPDANFKVSGSFEQLQHDFNKQQEYTGNQKKNHY